MWPKTDSGRGVKATAGALAACVLAASARGEAPDALLPEPGDVVAAYATLRGWVDAFELPGLDDPSARVPLRGAAGVCVILRQSGRVLAVGLGESGGDLMLRRAAGRALGEVLADPAVAGLPESLAEETGKALSIELEVAGSLVPLLGKTFGVVADQVDPGLDGVAIRRGDGLALLFPAQMRATNTAGHPERLLVPLAGDLGMVPAALPKLVERFGISIYRFRTTHLAQAGPGGPPFETFRGDQVVSERDVTGQSIARLADGLARHLIGSMSPVDEPLGLMGTYRPVPDRYDPLIAPPLEQALAAWALARYARMPHAMVDAETAGAAGAVAAQIVDELRTVMPGEDDPLADPVACAAIAYAGVELGALLPERPQRAEFIAEAVGRVVAACTEQPRLAPHGRAMIAAAAARLLAEDVQIEDLRVRDAIDAAWQSVPEHRQVMLLPWLGWAERDWAVATGALDAAAAQRLVKLRAYLDASRFGPARRPGPPDLAGGFALGGAGGRPMASSQTVRPAAYLAGMARDGDLTPPDEAQAALGRLLKTLRFIVQLSTRESAAWAYRNPGRALGGLRAAPWDADQPVAAQALGLIVATETLTSLEALQKPPGGA